MNLDSAVISVISAGVGAFFGAYLKRKGENVATKEDLADLVEQVKAVTEATKTIEAAITAEVWDKQKRWELKRDSLIDAVQALGQAEDALMNLAVLFANTKISESESSEFREQRHTSAQSWLAKMDAYDEKRRIVSLVCTRSTSSVLSRASNQIRTCASKVIRDEVDGYSEISPSIQEAVVNVFLVARSELGLDTTGEPTVSTSVVTAD